MRRAPSREAPATRIALLYPEDIALKIQIWPAALALLGMMGCGMDSEKKIPSDPARVAADAEFDTEDSDESDAAATHPGAVFTLGNGTAGNTVLVFARAADGSLTGPEVVATGGTGTGGGLGNQGAVTLGLESRLLFAVNPGSDDVSVFRVNGTALTLLSTTPSGGSRPISVAIHGRTLYVLNAGGDGTVAGFRVRNSGTLTPIPHAVLPLGSTASGPAQIAFSPDGRQLVVTEKATNTLAVYRVDEHGRAWGPRVNASSGQTPFGFAFTRRGDLIVSEAFGGASGLSAVSSYALRHGGSLRVVSGSIPTMQTAACWIVVTRGGRFAYTTNTGSNSITGYRVDRDGALTRLEADGVTATTDAGPIDAAFDTASRHLYVLNSGSQTIGAYVRGPGGRLTPLPGIGGLPVGSNGLAAY